jgi:catechol-2,3-dioxygenase
MKRLHLHLKVNDIDQAIGFYATLFAAKPSVVKPDYAKWLLDDPRLNFAISARGAEQAGLDHVGIQVEDAAELAEVYQRLQAADGPVQQQGAVVCCYHESEKSWITDPSGLRWEAFLTRGETTVYGDGAFHADPASACCGAAPVTKTAESCCISVTKSACCETPALAE